jgi:hypothetical protein
MILEMIAMKVNQELSKELEKLFEAYEIEVNDSLRKGLLKESSAKTYLLHSGNFIKWCRNDFSPGGRNK